MCICTYTHIIHFACCLKTLLKPPCLPILFPSSLQKDDGLMPLPLDIKNSTVVKTLSFPGVIYHLGEQQ